MRGKWPLLLMGLFLVVGENPLYAQVQATADSQILPDEQFRLAQNQFTHGEYDDAIANLTSLLYPIRLDSEDALVEARRILAIAYYLTQKRDMAAAEFTKLLYLQPTYKLDPFLVAPPIIEFFEQVRKKLKPQLDPIIATKMKEKSNLVNGCDLDVLSSQAIRVNYHYNKRALAFFPFGIGQLQNGHKALGYTSMSVQSATLALSMVSGIISTTATNNYTELLRNSANGKAPYNYDQLTTLHKRSRSMMVTNIVSLGVFALTWGLSIIHANYYYEPYTMELSQEPVDKEWIKREISR